MTSVCGHVMSLDFIGKCLVFSWVAFKMQANSVMCKSRDDANLSSSGIFPILNVLQESITTGIKSIQLSCSVKLRPRRRKPTPN